MTPSSSGLAAARDQRRPTGRGLSNERCALPAVDQCVSTTVGTRQPRRGSVLACPWEMSRSGWVIAWTPSYPHTSVPWKATSRSPTNGSSCCSRSEPSLWPARSCPPKAGPHRPGSSHRAVESRAACDSSPAAARAGCEALRWCPAAAENGFDRQRSELVEDEGAVTLVLEQPLDARQLLLLERVG